MTAFTLYIGLVVIPNFTNQISCQEAGEILQEVYDQPIVCVQEEKINLCV